MVIKSRVKFKYIVLLSVAAILIVGAWFVPLPSGKRASPDRKAVSEISGTRYYVNPASGTDSATGKSASESFKTIEQALERAQAGDAIELADGTYYENVHTIRSGAKGQPIVITGSRDAIVHGKQGRIFEITHDYITLTGFTINGKAGDSRDDVRDKLIYAIGTEPGDGVEGLLVDNLLLENAGGECVRLRYFAKNNEIRNSTIRNCGLYDFVYNEGGKNGEGIYIGTAPEQLSDGKNPTNERDVSTKNWIHHNTIETHGNECVDIKESSRENIVERNTCRYQLDPESAGLDSRGDYNIFRYNTVIGSVGAGVRLGGDGGGDGVGNDVYDNRLENNQGGSVKILRLPQGKICGNKLAGNNDAFESTQRADPDAPCD